MDEIYRILELQRSPNDPVNELLTDKYITESLQSRLNRELGLPPETAYFIQLERFYGLSMRIRFKSLKADIKPTVHHRLDKLSKRWLFALGFRKVHAISADEIKEMKARFVADIPEIEKYMLPSSSENITLYNGTILELYPKINEVKPLTDHEIFAKSINLLLANAEIIFSDSRMFMSPIDMNCGLAYCGKFAPATVGAYVEWWLNNSVARDENGNPIICLSGSPLSGCNRCASVTPEGEVITTSISNFSKAFKTFLDAANRYKAKAGKYEVYSFEKVISILKIRGIRGETANIKAENLQQKQKIDNLIDKQLQIQAYMEQKTDEYLRAILAPHIEQARLLYQKYIEIKVHTDALIGEYATIKSSAKKRLKQGEIVQKEYVEIRNDAKEKIAKLKSECDGWWMEHFTVLYGQNSRFFNLQTIQKLLND